MQFPIVAVRSHHHAPDDLFPVIAGPSSEIPVVLHADDGDLRTARARHLTVRRQREAQLKDLAVVRRENIDVTITDARVIVNCARASHAGGVLAGHVKYPWLVAVGGSEGEGRLGSRPKLRLIVQRMSGSYGVLTLRMTDGTDVHDLAQDIARRAARLWLEMHPGVPGEHTELWQRMAEVERGVASPGEYALHTMPAHVRVDSLSRPEVDARIRTA